MDCIQRSFADGRQRRYGQISDLNEQGLVCWMV